jgi:hypothetical protein
VAAKAAGVPRPPEDFLAEGEEAERSNEAGEVVY